MCLAPRHQVYQNRCSTGHIWASTVPALGDCDICLAETAIGFDLDSFAQLRLQDFKRKIIKLSWLETLRRVWGGRLIDAIFMPWPRWHVETDQEFRNRVRNLIKEGGKP